MSRLHIGRLHPELEQSLVRQVGDEKAADPLRPVVVAVGSNLVALYLRRLLGERLGGHVGVRFVTLIDLAEALAGAELRRDGSRPLPGLADWRAAVRVASEVEPDSVIAPVAGRPGFAKALAATFGELVDAGMDELAVPARSGKLAELAELYRRFRRYRGGAGGTGGVGTEGAAGADGDGRSGIVEGGGVEGDVIEGGVRLFGRAELLRAAAESVGRFPSRFGTDRLFVYGFYDLNESQRILLEACVRRLDVVAFLPFERVEEGRPTAPGEAESGSSVIGGRSGSYRFAEPTLAWYRELGMRPEPAAPESTEAAAATRATETPEAEPGAAQAKPDVEIVSASAETEEAREAVREVIKLAEAGVPLHEIAILYRQPDPYARLVREALEAADVPHFFPARDALADTSYGRAFAALLGMGTRGGAGFRRSDVIEWAYYAPVNWAECAAPGTRIVETFSGGRPAAEGDAASSASPASSAPAPDVAVWDAISAEAGVGGGSVGSGLDVWRTRIGSWRRRRGAEQGEPPGGEARRSAHRWDGQAEALLRFVETLGAAVEALPAAATWREWADALTGLARRLLLPDAHLDWLTDILSELRALEVVESGPVSFETARDAARELVGAATAAAGRYQRSGVTVADVMSVRGLRFRAVVLLGLVEKGFPVPARQDPILLDEERSRLGTLPLKRRRTEEESLLFTLATQSASAHLKLFYPRMDAQSGRVRTPSHFLLDLAGRLAGRRVDYDELERLPFHRRVPNARLHPGDEDGALDVREYDFGGLVRSVQPRVGRPAVAQPLEVIAGLERLSPSFHRGREAVRAWWGDRSLTRFDGIVPRASQPPESVYSASRLETYARCPHRYFLRYELGLNGSESPEDVKRLAPLDRGALVHEVLEGLFLRLGARGRAAPGPGPGRREQAVSLLERQFADTCARIESERVVGYPLLWELEREQIWEDLRAFLDDYLAEESEWVPSEVELAFGEAGEVEVSLEGGRTVRFQGKIDRLDRSADGQRARVVDYKTGGLKNRHDSPHPDGLTGGMHLQLPIYLLAAQALLPDVEMPNLEASYVYLSEAAKRKRIPFHGTVWAEKGESFRALVGSIVDGIEQGYFFQYPRLGDDELGNCRSCDFQRICGPSIAARAERKAGAPERARFHAMREVE